MPRSTAEHALLRRLPQVLLGRVELALEEADLSLETVCSRPAALLLVLASLCIMELRLCLFQIPLEEPELVLERGNLLVLLEILLVQALVVCLGRLGALDGGIGLNAERIEFLKKANKKGCQRDRAGDKDNQAHAERGERTSLIRSWR